MIEFWTVLAAVLPVFLAVATGGVIRRVNWLTEEADQSLVRLTINLLIPALILDALLGNEALDNGANVIAAPIVGFVTVVGGLYLASLLAPVFGLRESVRRRTFAFTTGIYNYGYVPIPLTVLLFDRETLGVLFLHNLGVEIALWTVCVGFLRGTGGGSPKALVNPPILAVVAGLGLHYTGLHSHVPEFVGTFVHLLGASAIPLALLLIGATMADNLTDFDPAKGLPTVVGACVLRLGLFSVLFLLLAVLLPVSLELKRVVVLQAAMPVATFPLIMAKHYGGHVATATRVVFWTSIVGLLTIPLWIRIGLALVAR